MKKQEPKEPLDDVEALEAMQGQPAADPDLTEQAEHEYKLNAKQQRLMEYVKANIPISGFAEVLTEELWLREVLKDVDSANPYVRTRALSMLGQFMGISGPGAKKKTAAPGVEVEFD